MLSGAAAEREDSPVESREGQSPPKQPHGTHHTPPPQPNGNQTPPVQPQECLMKPHGERVPPQQPNGNLISPMPGFTAHGPCSVRLLPQRKEGNRTLSNDMMSSNGEITFTAQTTTQEGEGSSSLSETRSLPPGMRTWTDPEGTERLLFPDSHPTDPEMDAMRKRMAAKYNPLMVPRSISKDGVMLGHTKWVWMERANNFVEKLAPLPDLEERIAAIEKPQGINTFNYASGEKEERLPLVTLGSTMGRASKFTEENLGEEISKLLESKEGGSNNGSLNGGSEDDSLDIDFEEDDLGHNCPRI
jgi:hypothetical protein